jgi:dinuclear metal center YbgI/SA1388 family protein
MMTTIKEITNYLEKLAPSAYQENYDNAGLIVGNPSEIVTGILVSLDCTEAVIDEAISMGCNMVVSHHPIVFKGLKKLNGKNYVERTVIKAIKNDIAIYASHTNLDHVQNGVNFKIASMLSLSNVRILSPKKNLLSTLKVFVPDTHAQPLLDVLHQAGAGQIGNYDQCSFVVNGTGTFRGNEMSDPAWGNKLEITKVKESSIEVVFPTYLSDKIIKAMQAAHPYQEVAYYLSNLENHNQAIGAGAIGNLAEPMHHDDFLKYLCQAMGIKVLKHTKTLDKPITKIAVCGGAGSFLLNDAIASGADVLITADYKYHEFFDAEDKILICDIGHYESEVCTKALLHDYLSKEFTNFATLISQVNTNPAIYYCN